MKKLTALLLAVLLCFGMTGAVAFADETESSAESREDEPGFVGGHDVTPAFASPLNLTVGDVIAFTVDAKNFDNASTFDLSMLNVFVGITPSGQTVSLDGKAYLAPQGFLRDAVTGAVTFSLKAAAACNLADFSVRVCVTSVGVIKVINGEETVEDTITMSLPCNFKAQIAAAASSSSVSSSSSSSTSASSSSSSAGESSSSQPVSSVPSSVPASSSSSVPESSSSRPVSPEESSASSVNPSSSSEAGSSQPESSDPQTVVSSTLESESSSQTESNSDVSSETSGKSSTPDSAASSGGQSENENDGGVISGLIEFFGGLFGAAPANQQVIAPAPANAPQGDPVSTPDDEIGIVNTTTTASAWEHKSGIPSLSMPSTIASNTPIVFKIPFNNFIATGTSGVAFSFNLQKFIDNPSTYEVNVEHAASGQSFSTNFTPTFINIGGSTIGTEIYGVSFMPKNIPVTGLLLPKGTTFSFKDATNKFTLAADLWIVPTFTGSPKANGIASGASLDGPGTWVTKNGQIYNNGFYDIDDVKAGDEFLIHFTPQYFTWTNNNMPTKVTLSSIRSNITMRSSLGTGSRVFESIELTSSKGEAVVRVKLRDQIPTVRPVDFIAKIFMYANKSREDSAGLEFTGTVAGADPTEFYREDKYIYIGDGTVGKAVETITKPEIYIGDDIYITMNLLTRGTKFYGTATLDELTEHDEEMVDKYPDIVHVYRLYTIGLNGAGSSVAFDGYGGMMYVYDGDFNYLGRSNQKLPYSDVYYLAAKMLDLEEEEEPEPVESVPEELLYPPPNTNDNPSTGGHSRRA